MTFWKFGFEHVQDLARAKRASLEPEEEDMGKDHGAASPRAASRAPRVGAVPNASCLRTTKYYSRATLRYKVNRPMFKAYTVLAKSMFSFSWWKH